MRKVFLPLALIVFSLASLPELRAGSLAGVTLPDSVRVAGSTLQLNGMGLRKKFVVKIYVAGLYVERKSSDAGAILKSEAPKRIVMQFLHGASKGQMTDAFVESFNNDAPEAKKTVQADIDRFLAALEPVKEGDQMVFTYLPGAGTTFAVNGRDKLTIATPNFAAVLFSVWLGPKPPNEEMKKGLLGQ